MRSVAKFLVAGMSFCLIGASVARAADPLDVPHVATLETGSVLADVAITAGSTGAPAGFTVQWMKASDFDALGGWPVDESSRALNVASFLGVPTLNTIDGTVSFMLSPYETATIQLGDLFDETGVLTIRGAHELESGTTYVYRVRANGSDDPTAPFSPSDYGADSRFDTSPHSDVEDCVHSAGHWRSHSEKWPVSSLRLGSVVYTKAQLLNILDRSAQGNGLVSLVHELVAAKLNLLAGAQASPSLLLAVQQADALIGSLVVPPYGNGFLNPEHTNALTDDLEHFSDNEDEHECVRVVSVKPTTWAKVKSFYR